MQIDTSPSVAHSAACIEDVSRTLAVQDSLHVVEHVFALRVQASVGMQLSFITADRTTS